VTAHKLSKILTDEPENSQQVKQLYFNLDYQLVCCGSI